MATDAYCVRDTCDDASATKIIKYIYLYIFLFSYSYNNNEEPNVVE